MPRFKMVDGVSIQLTDAEETARDNEEAAWAADEGNRALAGMRQDRNRLLADTDFYALSDVTMTDAMTTYRQALRDITAHSNFPHNLTDDDWPTKP